MHNSETQLSSLNKLTSTIIIVLIAVCAFRASAQNAAFDICPIKNSQEVPSAQVFDIEGNALDLKAYVGNRASILVFYRGGWCPYCIRHLSALQDIMHNIEELGYELIAIAPDDFTNLEESIKKSKGLDYTLISDKQANAMKAFGIGWSVDDEMFTKYIDQYAIDLEAWSGKSHHMLPVPSVFIVEDGKIKYQHVDPNYSQRLSGELLLSFLKN